MDTESPQCGAGNQRSLKEIAKRKKESQKRNLSIIIGLENISIRISNIFWGTEKADEQIIKELSSVFESVENFALCET